MQVQLHLVEHIHIQVLALNNNVETRIAFIGKIVRVGDGLCAAFIK